MIKTKFIAAMLLISTLSTGAQNVIQRVPGSPYPASSAPDILYLTSESLSYSERIAIQSLQGILAKTKPEILRDVHGHKAMVQASGIGINTSFYLDFQGLLNKFANRLSGYILCDSKQSSTNVALSLSGVYNAVAIPADIESMAVNAGLTKKIDVRGKDENWALANYGGLFSTSIASYQNCSDDRGLFLGDYTAYTGAFQFWDASATGNLAKNMYGRMMPGAIFFGWGAGEYETVEQLSQRSLMIHPSDFSPNLSTLTNIPTVLPKQKDPVAPFKVVPNVHTVCFVMSDGDNIQWLSGASDNTGTWANPNRARVNLGWTISPAMAELAPIVYKKYVDNALTTDEGRNLLVAGPSGKGYFFPGIYPNLTQECQLLNRYMRKADLSIVNIIDVDNGAHNPDEYLKQSHIDALFYYTYGANYTGMNGKIAWYKDKPSIGGRYTLWGTLSSPETLAQKLNSAPTDIHSENGYSLIPVHVWSRNVTDVMNCISLLGPNVRVVAPDEFVWLVRKNIKGLPLGYGNGLTGEYFAGTSFDMLKQMKNDGKIDFDWETGSPAPALIGNDNFSTRWSGQLQAIYSETYTLHLTTDDGVKLTVNGQMLIDQLSSTGHAAHTATIQLAAGSKYNIVLEYIERTGNASCLLEWESPSQVRQAVPRTQLYSPATPTTGLVTAFANTVHTGFSCGLKPGNYSLSDLNALGIADNGIASISITAGFKAVLYENDHFGGQTTEITASTANLGEWAGKVSSLQIKTNGVQGLDGVYYIKNRQSNLHLDVTGGIGGIGDGTNIQQWNTTPNTNQQFKLTHLGDGTYQILAMHSAKSLDVSNFGLDDGANLQLWTYYGSSNQQFIIMEAPGVPGFYHFIAKHSGKLVETVDSNPEANVRQWTNNNQVRGQWSLITVPKLVNGSGNGLNAEYYNGTNFETKRITSIDSQIDFNWGPTAPNAWVSADRFSVRWHGYVEPRFSNTYTFYLNSDNGRRLWVNNQLIIDKWINDYDVEYSGSIPLLAGQKYDIKLEYFEDFGGAYCKMEWKSNQQPREIVPQSQLYSSVATSSTSPTQKPINVEIFPNPTRGNLHIKLSGLPAPNTNATLAIYSLTGTMVLQTNVCESDSINLSAIPQGPYLVLLHVGGTCFRQQIIKT